MNSYNNKKKSYLFKKWKEIYEIVISEMKKELNDSEVLLKKTPLQQRYLLEGCIKFIKTQIHEKEYIARCIQNNPMAENSLNEIGDFFNCQIRGVWDKLKIVENENKSLKRELVIRKVLPDIICLDIQTIKIILSYCFN